MFREPLDWIIIVTAVLLATVLTWFFMSLPDCAPDTAGNCAFYSSP